MEIIHTVTSRKRFTHFWSIYIFLVGGILLVFYEVHQLGSQDLNFYVTSAVVMFLIFFLPTIYVHLQYHGKNRNAKLRIDYQNGVGEYEHNRERIRFHFSDIKLIEQYKTPPVAEKRWPWLPWATYNYAKVILNNGKEFIITCFLVDEFELPIDSSKIKLHRILYPNIKR